MEGPLVAEGGKEKKRKMGREKRREGRRDKKKDIKIQTVPQITVCQVF